MYCTVDSFSVDTVRLWFSAFLTSNQALCVNQISERCGVIGSSLYNINHTTSKIRPLKMSTECQHLKYLSSALMFSVYSDNYMLSVHCLQYICCSTLFPMSAHTHTQQGPVLACDVWGMRHEDWRPRGPTGMSDCQGEVDEKNMQRQLKQQHVLQAFINPGLVWVQIVEQTLS